jgi:hypothetical protein
MSALFFVTSVTIFMMSLISEQVCQMRYERRATPRIVKKKSEIENTNNRANEN